MIMERIKKWCYWTFILLQAISIIVFLLLASHYIYEHKNSISDFYSDLYILNGACFWNMITAIATAIAAICAYCAYNQSITMRKHSSFDSLFTQLLSNMQCFISSVSLQETAMKKDALFFTEGIVDKNIADSCFNEKYNTFLNFCNIYTNYTNKQDKKLDEKKIEQLWNTYTNSLVNQSNFLNCFKFFYHMANTVIDSPLDENYKKKYIGIIQSQLNLDILFCYFINLIAASHGKETGYCTKLKQYKFFKNLFEDYNGYRKLITDTVPIYLIEKIYKDK